MSDSPYPQHTIYIPCYNCAPQVKRLIEKLKAFGLEKLPDLVFIDNCSTDSTREVILDALATTSRFQLIEHLENYGLGGSFKTAIELSDERQDECIFWFHGDDQADVGDLEQVVRRMSRSNTDAIFGARFMAQSQLKNYSKTRELGNRILNQIFSLSLGQKIYELGSGLAAFRRSALPTDIVLSWPSHIAFDIRLLFRFTDSRNGFRTEFFPIHWSEEDQVSNAHNVKTGLLLIRELMLFLLRKQTVELPTKRQWRVSEADHADGR